MDSFCQRVKIQICEHMNHREKRYSCLYGILYAQGQKDSVFHIQTECKQFADLLSELIFEHSGHKLSVQSLPRGTDILYSVIADQQLSTGLRTLFHLDQKEITEETIPKKSRKAFMSGVFLCCGSVSDPERDYHLEMNLPDTETAEQILKMVAHTDFNFKQISRRGAEVLYLKSSKTIEDFITFVGAGQATLELINTEILKDYKNQINRLNNCSEANYKKTQKASEQQIEDILYFSETMGLDKLPKDLREIALLRLEYPEENFAEIGSRLDIPLGKTGVCRRMKKIQDLAHHIQENGGVIPHDSE